MSRVFRGLNAIALCLLALVLSSALLSQILPGAGLVQAVDAQDGQLAAEPGTINIYRQPKIKNDAVQIVEIKEGSDEVVPGVFRVPPYETPGGSIPATADWIEDLSISFKNVTSLKIEFIRINASFLYGDQRSDWRHQAHWDLNLGEVPPLLASSYGKFKAPHGTGKPLELGPGQVVTVSLSDYIQEITAKIEAKTPLYKVNRFVIGLYEAYFDQPGLVWGSPCCWTATDADSPVGPKQLPRGFFPGDLSQQTFDRDPLH